VVFTGDRHQVLTNVPTGSAPFPFWGLCRVPRDSGNREPPAVDDTCAALIAVIAIEMIEGATWRFRFAIVGFNLARGSRHRHRRGHARRGARRGGMVAGNVQIDLRFVVCRCVYGPGAADDIPAFPEWHTASHQRPGLALTRLRVNKKGDSSAAAIPMIARGAV